MPYEKKYLSESDTDDQYIPIPIFSISGEKTSVHQTAWSTPYEELRLGIGRLDLSI